LLYRAAHASRLSSRYDDAQRLLEEARSLVDEHEEPLLSSRLLSEWCEVTWEASGPSTSLVGERYDAVHLSEAYPDSLERVTALARLAEAECWDRRGDSARAHSEEALRVARRNGSDLALARALNTWAFVHLEETAPAMGAAQEALRLARRCGEVKEVVLGSIWLMNLLIVQLRVEEAVQVGRPAFAEASRLGDTHWCHFIGTMAADCLLRLGRFEEAGDLLRESLAVRCVGVPGALTRWVPPGSRCGRGSSTPPAAT
jgi:tetratricopeptide (TPR) repeat protein